jgi:hypothetical protein
MGIFNTLIDSYKESLRKKYLKKDIKEVKILLEKEGFKTSRIYGYKNVKRLTATNSERNRLDFIFSEKNKYILFNYGFSNSELRSIELISTSKRMEKKFNPLKIKNEISSHIMKISAVYFGETSKSSNLKFNSKDVFFIKNEIYSDMRKVMKMRAVNRMFNIRNRILDYEIDKNKLKQLTSISGEKKLALFKRVSKKLFESLYKRDIESYRFNNRNMWEGKESTLGLFDLEYIKGFFFEEEFFLKYTFTEEEFYDFFFNQFKEYVYLNIDVLVENIKDSEIKQKKEELNGYLINLEENIKKMLLEEEKKAIRFTKNVKEIFFELVKEKRKDISPPKKSQKDKLDQIPF